ncbi:channel protein TolC [Pseudomonas sp. FFUP_PS_473]|uniref:TolC family outer membrane protein n=1 Tax=Pseudomonas sp. FFUP_PS_473 TaxID=2060418 RepID=UPI000C7A22E7|nr:TolC family outer membrane protein [Pseudomonas sp. FFUP_PS_473]PLP86106.1 channel protein TolC [Pseudomonas sp. FFUP_PS_473]
MRRFIALCLSLPLSALPICSSADEARPNYVDLWQLQQEARGADPRVLKAQAQVRSGEGRKDEAFGQLLPQLNANGSFNRSRRDDNLSRTEYNGKRAAIALNQVIYDPQAWRSYQKFSELAKQSEYDSADAQVLSSIDLTERYFAVLAAEDELSLVQKEREVTQHNLDRATRLLADKLTTITDKLDIEARLNKLEADEIEAQNKVQTSREAISELVGRDVQEPLKRIGDEPAFSLPAQQMNYWVEAALQNNPALQAREHSVNAAEAAVGEAKARHLPRLGLNLSAQRSDIGYEGTLTPRSDNMVASLDLQVPLFSGGSTSARVVASEGDKDAAQQELEALRREVVKETRSAYIGITAGLSRIKATRRALYSASASRQATEKAFQYHQKNAADVLDSIQDEFRARRDLYQSQYKFITNLLVLHRWSGRLADADIQRANDWLVAPLDGLK